MVPDDADSDDNGELVAPPLAGDFGADDAPLLNRAARDLGFKGTISTETGQDSKILAQVAGDKAKGFMSVGGASTPEIQSDYMKEFIEAARTHKPAYQYASAGNGTLNHLLGAMLNQAAGLQLGHVPYKGVAPALNDVLGGQIPMAFASLPSCVQHIKAGKLRALGVSSPRRSPFAPDIPAIAETLPGFTSGGWFGMIAPAGLPKEIVAKLADKHPDIRKHLLRIADELRIEADAYRKRHNL